MKIKLIDMKKVELDNIMIADFINEAEKLGFVRWYYSRKELKGWIILGDSYGK